jgi:hypothetical protein
MHSSTWLGLRYVEGQGVDQNDKEEEAMRWYLMAADQGLAHAKYNVGLVHDKCQGVDQNNEEAFNVGTKRGSCTI